MDDLEFLDHGSATLMVLLPDGSVVHIPNIDSLKILDTCPLLFHAFEFRESTCVQHASIEVRAFPCAWLATDGHSLGHIAIRYRLTAPLPVYRHLPC